MKTTKRLLSFILVLTMLLTMATFPAFAEDTYTYTPKAIVLEATKFNTPYFDSTEPRLFAKVSEYNIFVGDYLALPEGGLKLQKSAPVDIAAGNSPTGAKVKPKGIAIDVFQNYTAVNTWNNRAVDGVNRFYFAYDASIGTYGAFTGIYATMEDMVAGKNALKGIELKYAGLWAVGMRAAVYYDDSTPAKLCLYSSSGQHYDSLSNNATPYSFTFTVKAKPTTPNYEVVAPTVSDAVKAQAGTIDVSGFTKGDPAGNNGNYVYARTFAVDANKNVVVSYRNPKHTAGNAATVILGSFSGFAIDFASKAYVQDFTFKMSAKKVVYDLYGSMDGENWYIIKQKVTRDTSSESHTITVGAIVKYLRFDILQHENTWGYVQNGALTAMTGVLNLPDGFNVTVEGATTATLKTDAKGKLDFSSIVAQFPVDEYTYKIDGVDLTEELSTGIYAFTDDKTIVIEEAAVFTGYTVTVEGATTATLTTDADGKLDFSSIVAQFPVDGYTYKIGDEDVTEALANGTYVFTADATVVIEEIVVPEEPEEPQDPNYVYTYTPKTVEFKVKNIPTGSTDLAFNNANNGPLVAPRETIYLGDTISIPNEVYQSVTTGHSTAVKITRIKVAFMRYSSDETGTDKGSSYWAGDYEADVVYTPDKAGYYSLYINGYEYVDAEGNLTIKNTVNSHRYYCCAFEVKETPTSAPKTVVAPKYEGATGETTTLTTTKAFRKSYAGDSTAYDPHEFAVTSAMSLSNPAGCTLYYQFNLETLSYVTTIELSDSNKLIYDYDTYGSMDGENWYLLYTGTSTTAKYTVNGVANFVRLVPRGAKGWTSTPTAYAVKGYTISASDVNKKPAASWVKADGTKTEITSTKSLPVAYSAGSKNYAITGWKVETGNGFAVTSLVDIANNNLGDVYAVVEEIPFAVSALEGALAPAGDDEGKTFKANQYLNGFYVEGTQIRLPVGSGETEIPGGLRFVNIIDNDLIATLNALRDTGDVTGFEYGTVAITATQYVGGDLAIGYTQKNGKPAKYSVGERVFESADNFEEEYFKYTVCITNIPEANYTTDIIVRPYLTITKSDGSTVTVYGEQYATSIYKAAKFALDNDANLTPEETTHLNNIISVVE